MFDNVLNYARVHPLTQRLIVDQSTPGQRSARARIAIPGNGAHGQFAAQEMPSGLTLVTMNGYLENEYRQRGIPEPGYDIPFGLSILLAGRNVLRLRDHSIHRSPACGEVWCQSGAFDLEESVMLAGKFRNCHIAVSSALLQRWLQTLSHDSPAQRQIDAVLSNRNLRQRLSFHPLPAAMADVAITLNTLSLAGENERNWREHADSAEEMTAGTLTFGQRLQTEGLTLLGQWLDLSRVRDTDKYRSRVYRAVDEAIDIIAREYGSNELSIGALALRTGINECYLKRGFRERTGLGIAQYIRRQRMHAALALLAEGVFSVRQTANHVGYRSLGHFARAFRAQHQCLPSEIAAR